MLNIIHAVSPALNTAPTDVVPSLVYGVSPWRSVAPGAYCAGVKYRGRPSSPLPGSTYRSLTAYVRFFTAWLPGVYTGFPPSCGNS